MAKKKDKLPLPPEARFEHDLDFPDDTYSRYSREAIQQQKDMIERLKKAQQGGSADD